MKVKQFLNKFLYASSSIKFVYLADQVGHELLLQTNILADPVKPGSANCNTGLCGRSRGHRPGTYHAGETCARRRLNYIAGWNDRRENSGPYKRDKGTVGRYICKSIRDYYNANHCGSGCGDLPVEHKREFQKLYSDVLAEYTGRRAGVF